MKKILKTKKIQLLKKYFEKKKPVVLAFLFGSFAKGLEMEKSDIDVAIYLKEPQRRTKIWLAISRILEREVDLVCLNEKGILATLISHIFKTGIPLVIKDKKNILEALFKKKLRS